MTPTTLKSSPIIFHIADAAEWKAGARAGAYRPESLMSEGFIHCSVGPQLAATANFLFAGRTGLVLLAIDIDRLRFPVKFEGLTQNVFPHIYGPLNPSAVVAEFRFEEGSEGIFRLPQAARRLCPWSARLSELLRAADSDPLLSGHVSPDDLDLPRLPIWLENDIVGFATPRQDLDGTWRMGAIYVDPDYRGQGLATRAITGFMTDRLGRAFIEFGNMACKKAFNAAGFRPYRKDDTGEWWTNLPMLAEHTQLPF